MAAPPGVAVAAPETAPPPTPVAPVVTTAHALVDQAKARRASDPAGALQLAQAALALDRGDAQTQALVRELTPKPAQIAVPAAVTPTAEPTPGHHLGVVKPAAKAKPGKTTLGPALME